MNISVLLILVFICFGSLVACNNVNVNVRVNLASRGHNKASSHTPTVPVVTPIVAPIKLYNHEIGVLISSCPYPNPSGTLCGSNSICECPSGNVHKESFSLHTVLNGQLENRGTIALHQVKTGMNRTFVALEDLEYPFILCSSHEEHIGCNANSNPLAILHKKGDRFTFDFPEEMIYGYGSPDAEGMGNSIEAVHNPTAAPTEGELDWIRDAYYGATNWALSHPDTVVRACISACNFICNHFCN